MSNTLDIEQIHMNFVKKYMIRQRKTTTEELRRIKAGGEPIPVPERKSAERVFDAVRNIVASESKSGKLK